MSKRQIWGLAMGSLIAAFTVAGTAQAAAQECGRVGAWFGEAAPGMKWIDNITPGTSATTGQINLTWVTVDPSYGAKLPAQNLTNAQGRWEKVNQRTYTYTWFAYGTSPVATEYPPGFPATLEATVYVLRASGELTLIDCDHTTLTYKAEFMSPDMTTMYAVFTGTGTETRMPMVTAP
jgi:hypothetical protein